MPMKIACPECQKSLKVEDRLAGKRVRCPNCQTPFTIPQPTEEAAESPIDDELPQRTPVKKSAPKKPIVPPADDDFDAEDDEAYGLKKPSRSAEDDEDEYQPQQVKPRRIAAARASDDDESAATFSSDGDGSWRKHLHWLLALALVPLAMSMIWKDDSSFEDRLEKTVKAHPEVVPQLQQLPQGADLGALFDALPSNRLDGALLARRSWVHWGFALASAAGFLALLTLMFPGCTASPSRLLMTGLITGTVGIVLLLGFQWVAAFTQGFNVRGRGLLIVLFYIVKFIGFSYRCAIEEGNGFALSFMGFTLGVGLCEEICKAIPIAIYLNTARDANWKGACVVGLASGIGFGVSEGITYSSDFYNGISGPMIYLVRFLSCVALHALWSGCVAQLMYRNQDHIAEFSWESTFGFIAYYLSIAMVLHGLYDTLLKQEHHLWALAIAAASFGWFVVMVAKQADDD